MTVRPDLRCLMMVAVVALGGLGPAQAADAVFAEPALPRVRVVRRPLRVLPPPPAVIISGYLPRNNAVPMYNEPPRRPSYAPLWR